MFFSPILRLMQYSKERFPIIPVLIFSFSYAGLAVGLSPESIQPEKGLVLFLAFGLIFFLFLFRTRVVDEFKDSLHDQEHYPNRPIPRGFIGKKELTRWGILAFLAEIATVAFLGLTSVIFYLPVIIYSVLMAQEFFAPRFLTRHFTLYYISHEILFIFFGIFYLASIGVLFTWTIPENTLAILVLAILPSLVEILRKFQPRLNAHGQVVQDSYSVVWGRANTLLILVLFAILMAGILSYLESNILFLLMGAIGMSILVVPPKIPDKVAVVVSALTLIGLVIGLYL